MTIGRRSFLIATGAMAGAGALPVAEAVAAPAGGARSVTEFGVEPNGAGDQSKALQSAIETIAGSGHVVLIPGGSFQVSSVSLPARCAIIGVPGQTRLIATGADACFLADGAVSLKVSGLEVEGSLVSGTVADVSITAISVRKARLAALDMTVSGSVSVSQCRFVSCAAEAIALRTDAGAEAGALVTGNHIVDCAEGIRLEGSGTVSGNLVSGASTFGLRLGRDMEAGVISAIGNTLRDCEIGIGVTAGGETILASLNLIAAARKAAIRAVDGDTLVGPDLARESAEAYLNLTLAGNVAR